MDIILSVISTNLGYFGCLCPTLRLIALWQTKPIFSGSACLSFLKNNPIFSNKNAFKIGQFTHFICFLQGIFISRHWPEMYRPNSPPATTMNGPDQQQQPQKQQQLTNYQKLQQKLQQQANQQQNW